MRAYNMAMLLILVNAGYAIVDQIGVFGADITNRAGGWNALSWLSNPIISNFEIPIYGDISFDVTGVTALATAIALGTIIIVNTNFVNDRGIAVVAFTALFYGSVFLTGVNVFANHNLPGLEIFYTIYFLVCSLIYIIAIIQMPTGGQKAHV